MIVYVNVCSAAQPVDRVSAFAMKEEADRHRREMLREGFQVEPRRLVIDNREMLAAQINALCAEAALGTARAEAYTHVTRPAPGMETL